MSDIVSRQLNWLLRPIQPQGLNVYCFGEQKTPESFRQACKRFFFLTRAAPIWARWPSRL
jgi:hypothetical protein